MSHTLAITAAVFAYAALGFLLFISLREKRRYRAELAAWKSRLQSDTLQSRNERDRLLDALGDAFLLVDSTETIRFANKAARALFEGREIVDRQVREAFLDGRLAEALLHCLDTGEPVQSRVVLPQQTSPRGDLETRGVNAWVIDAARLPDSPDSNPLTRVVIRDVTSEHQLEQVRKDFVANASHELRTPLAIINGYLENLLDEGMLDDRDMTRRFLTVMRKHSDRISRIVEDMLVISRLESGEAAALKLEPFKFRSCIHDIVERLESVISQQNADVHVTMPDETLRLNADRFYWTQVLFNLVENALKQNPHKGLRIEIGCLRQPHGIRIWVADNGVGIPSADLPHIFERFYRADRSRGASGARGMGRSTGLGLSIVKHIVAAHGGEVGAASPYGSGARVWFRLPPAALPPDESAASLAEG
jgi:two-component system phosphate regulon sensor histidine kinase PhoR